MPIPALGFIAGIALRYPRLTKFLARFGKWIALALAIAGLVWAALSWFNGKIEAADQAGYARAEAQFAEQVRAANEQAAKDQARMDQMALTFGHLATQREQDITLKIEPQIERIEREVASDARYRECVVTDGVLNELNAGRATVNAGIAASNP